MHTEGTWSLLKYIIHQSAFPLLRSSDFLFSLLPANSEEEICFRDSFLVGRTRGLFIPPEVTIRRYRWIHLNMTVSWTVHDVAVYVGDDWYTYMSFEWEE